MPYNNTTFSQPGVRGTGPSTVRSATPAAGSLGDYLTGIANNQQQARQHGQGNTLPVGTQVGSTAGIQSIAGNTPNWTANYGAAGRPFQPPTFTSGTNNYGTENTYDPWASASPQSQPTTGSPSAFPSPQPLTTNPSSNGIWAGGTQAPPFDKNGYPINNYGTAPPPTPYSKPLPPGQNNPDGSQQGGYGSPPLIPTQSPFGSSFGNAMFPNIPNATAATPYQGGYITNDMTSANGAPLESRSGAVGGDAGGSLMNPWMNQGVAGQMGLNPAMVWGQTQGPPRIRTY